MSLKHAILAILELEEGSGYDIAKRFNSSIGHFWSSSHQQVYKELHNLHSDGLLHCEVVKQEGKPDKKVYSLTELGTLELADWSKQPVKQYKFKDPLLVKLYAGKHAPESNLLAELQHHKELHQETLNEYSRLNRKLEEMDAPSRSKYRFSAMTLRLGMKLEEAWLEWADEIKSELQRD